MNNSDQKQSKKSKKIEGALDPIKEQVIEEPLKEKTKVSKHKKTLETVPEAHSDSKDTLEEKPKKSRAKKIESKNNTPIDESNVEEKSKKPKSKNSENYVENTLVETDKKEVNKTQEHTVDMKDETFIQQSEIDCLLLNSQKSKKAFLTYYDNIIDNISQMQKNTKSIDTIRASTNNIYQNMFDILSNNNLLINHIHNLHTNFVIAANNKLTKEQYLEITKECCSNIDRLRDTYISNADQHNESLTRLYVQLNDFLMSLQNTNSSFKLDKSIKSIINSDSENSDTGSDKLESKSGSKPTKTLKLEKSIIKSESDSDSD